MLKVLEYIKGHKDWEELLSQAPYFIKISRDVMFGKRLIMLKYNQLDSDFNEEIVRECRGLIIDEDSLEPVSVPFFKFGNYGESYCPEIDWESAVITEKRDGCVSCDTLILTKEGNIRIDEIIKDPKKYHILTFNHINDCIEEDEIEAFSIQDSIDNWYEIELENGYKLKVTGNHLIWCDNLKCYRRVDELDGNEELLIY